MSAGVRPDLARRTQVVAAVLLLGCWAWSQADGVGSRVATPAVPPSGWCAVPYANGQAVVTGGTRDDDCETILIVSAFGPARYSTTVTLRTTASEPAPLPLVWKPSPTGPRREVKLPVSDAAAALSPVSWSRPASRVRRVFLPRPGCRGADPADYDLLECIPVVCRGRCEIWRDAAAVWSDEFTDWAGQVANVIEDALPAVERCQGPIADIDASGCVTVVVTPRVAGYSQTKPPLRAFVRPTDFRPGLDRPWSNQGDLVYLQPGSPVETLRPVLTHELTHLAHLSWCRDTFGSDPWPMPEWIAEAVAHATEVQLTGSDTNVASRLEAFLSAPETCPLVVNESAAIATWRDPGSRGAACAFGLWCAERQGPRWWQTWTAADPSVLDPWSVFGEPSFAEVYRQWTIALSHHAAMTLSEITANDTITIRGTASKYFRLGDETRDLIVEAPAEAAVQVTLVRRPRRDDGPHARMSVTTFPATSVSR